MSYESWIAELERLDHEKVGEAVARLGTAWDAAVEAVVREIAAADPREGARLRAALSRPAAQALVAWAERMASLAVRRGDPELVVLGLAALSLAGDSLVDERERLIPVPLHRRAAKLVGEKPKRLFDAAAALTDEEGARWLGQLRGSRMKPRHMAFEEGADADGFRFLQRPPPGMTREQLDALSHGDEPVV